MAYDEALADRVRSAIGRRATVTEKMMFGGVAFLLDGKMFVGVTKDELMVRVGPERYAEALDEPHVRPMDFTGKPMNGYVFVGPKGIASQPSVKRWVQRGLDFVSSLRTASTPKRSSRANSKRR